MTKKTLTLLLIFSLVLGLCACSADAGSTKPAAAAPAPADAGAELSPDWVGELDEAQEANQLFIVAAIGKTTAYVSMHEKGDDGVWRQLMTTPGFIGKNGLGKTKEGDGMTPVGVFSFNRAFGIAEDPGCAIPYLQADDDTYWSGDQREGYHYNEMVSLKDLPDLNVDDSEHIVDYVYQYQYCLNISYNEDCVPGAGSAIFLHCLGPMKPYTGGCVMHSLRYAGDESADEETLRWLNDHDGGRAYDQCIRFLCDFHSPVTGETAWEPDTEYTGWSWFLGRVEGGGWELVDRGY